MCDPRFAASALLGWELDDFQGARLKLDWWFPYTIDSSGTMTGKTVGIFAHSCLRGMLLPDQVVGCYFPTQAIGQTEFWPYFAASMERSPLFREQCRMHRRRAGEDKSIHGVWQWHWENGSRIEMPAPNFMQDSKTQGGRSFNTLWVDERNKVEEMGDGFRKQLLERARRPLPRAWEGHTNCPIRGNHVHAKGHAEKISHKGYELVKAFKKLIQKGRSEGVLYSKHALQSWCYRDIGPRFKFLKDNLATIVETQKASALEGAAGLQGDYKHRILGLWGRDGHTFYAPGVLDEGQHPGLRPELQRTCDAIYFLGFDSAAPGSRLKADWCAATVLRLRQIDLKARKDEMRFQNAETGVKFFRVGDAVFEMAIVFAWMGRDLDAGELAGLIHHLDQRFSFSGICMDPGAGGGGRFIYKELLKPEATWGGVTRRVVPLCTKDEPVSSDKRAIVHMFARGGEFDLLPFIGGESGTDFLKDDAGFLAAFHTNYAKRWHAHQIAWPQRMSERPRGEVEAFWQMDEVIAQKTIEAGIHQLGNVQQQLANDGVTPLTSRYGYPLFHSAGKKDVAYTGLYAHAAAELWLWQQHGGGGAGEEDEEGGVYV
jgi:hypothetical protein